jgi:heme-degrading monooxygenase HmoA
MVARVTLAEVDLVRTSLESVIELYRESVLPTLHEHDGYEGGYVLVTPEGKALALTFWETEEDAEAGLASGMYAANVERFVTVFRSPPGRETYDVVIAEPPWVPVG